MICACRKLQVESLASSAKVFQVAGDVKDLCLGVDNTWALLSSCIRQFHMFIRQACKSIMVYSIAEGHCPMAKAHVFMQVVLLSSVSS